MNNNNREATKKMREFADFIAEVLLLERPDYSSFTDTHKFINDNIKAFNNFKNHELSPEEEDFFFIN